MKLSKIQKKLDPKVLQEGRSMTLKYGIYPLIWLFISIFLVAFILDIIGIDPFKSNLGFSIFLFSMLFPSMFGVYKLFTNPSAKYYKKISNTFKINVWPLRPFTTKEIQFVSKHFKEIKWKYTLDTLKTDIVGEDKFQQQREKALDKNYKYVKKFTELDNMQMKKLQTMYYIIISLTGFSIYYFI